MFSLEFEPPDLERFDALQLGMESARAGGTTGAVLNAANEAAVAGFLAGRLGFEETGRPLEFIGRIGICNSALAATTTFSSQFSALIFCGP